MLAANMTDAPLFTTDDFRRAMRRLAASVTIVTAVEDGTRHGMAATAVCSLGVAPPSLLVCIGHSASLHDPLVRSGTFAVNVLHPSQSGMVRRFSGGEKGDARFWGADWSSDPNGVPVLAAAQAAFSCRVEATFGHAGHTVVVGSVISVRDGGEVRPLVWCDGSFAEVTLVGDDGA